MQSDCSVKQQIEQQEDVKQLKRPHQLNTAASRYDMERLAARCLISDDTCARLVLQYRSCWKLALNSQYGRGAGGGSDTDVRILGPGHSLGGRTAQVSCSSFRVALNN